jgi:hypothetical protein
MEIRIEDLEQSQNEVGIPIASPSGPLELNYEPNLPDFNVLPSEIKDKM